MHYRSMQNKLKSKIHQLKKLLNLSHRCLLNSLQSHQQQLKWHKIKHRALQINKMLLKKIYLHLMQKYKHNLPWKMSKQFYQLEWKLGVIKKSPRWRRKTLIKLLRKCRKPTKHSILKIQGKIFHLMKFNLRRRPLSIMLKLKTHLQSNSQKERVMQNTYSRFVERLG